MEMLYSVVDMTLSYSDERWRRECCYSNRWRSSDKLSSLRLILRL